MCRKTTISNSSIRCRDWPTGHLSKIVSESSADDTTAAIGRFRTGAINKHDRLFKRHRYISYFNDRFGDLNTMDARFNSERSSGHGFFDTCTCR